MMFLIGAVPVWSTLVSCAYAALTCSLYVSHAAELVVDGGPCEYLHHHHSATSNSNGT